MVLIRASRRAVGALKPVDCSRCAENVVVVQNFLTRMALMGRGLPVRAATRSHTTPPTWPAAYGIRVPVSAGRPRVCTTVSTSSCIEKSGLSA